MSIKILVQQDEDEGNWISVDGSLSSLDNIRDVWCCERGVHIKYIRDPDVVIIGLRGNREAAEECAKKIVGIIRGIIMPYAKDVDCETSLEQQTKEDNVDEQHWM